MGGHPIAISNQEVTARLLIDRVLPAVGSISNSSSAAAVIASAMSDSFPAS